MGRWELPGGARLAMSFVVNVEEGSEMTIADGDRGPEMVDELGVELRRPVRNFGNESNYRYGIKAGGPRIIDLLEKHAVRATFTAAAVSLERAPQLTARIVAGGHEVCAHGWRWIHQFRMKAKEERAFIRKAVRSIEQTTGTRPYGWLSRYLLSPNTRRLLADEGFTYHMDDYSDDVPFWDTSGKKPIIVLPYALDTNDMKMWTAPAWAPGAWLQYALDTFDRLYGEGEAAPKVMSLGLHLRIIGRPGRIGYLEKFIEHVARHDAVWIASRKEISDHWAEQNPPRGS